MTDYIIREDDRAFVFGGTSIFEYGIKVDDNDNELLDITNIWQGRYLSEKNKDDFREGLKNSMGKPSKGRTTGNDYMISRGDRVFVFGITGMFEYRWNLVGGNEILELHKGWESKSVSEDVKDIIRKYAKERATGIKEEVSKSTTNEAGAGIDANILDTGVEETGVDAILDTTPSGSINEESFGIDGSIKKKGGPPPR